MNEHGYEIGRDRRISILDGIELRGLTWCGGQNHASLLMRIYDLKSMSSTDHRYGNAHDDIWQHTVNNDDWENDWVYTDRRFQLLDGTDQIFLSFLQLVLSPKVRKNVQSQLDLSEDFNKALSTFDLRFVPTSSIGPLKNYSFVRDGGLGNSIELARNLGVKLDAPYFFKEVERLTRSVQFGDEAQLIGDAKDLLETVALTIIEQRGGEEPSSKDLQPRVKAAILKRFAASG